MTISPAIALDAFHWTPQPPAQELLLELVHEFLANCPRASALADSMRREAGVRFIDLIDHILLGHADSRIHRLESVGYRTASAVYSHPAGMFPDLAIGERFEVALKVESVADFLAVNAIQAEILGEPLSPLRSAIIDRPTPLLRLSIIERHGVGSFATPPPSLALPWLEHLEAFRMRRRDFIADEEGFSHAHHLLDAAIADLGRDLTCDLFFAAEREFWQRRNTAAKVQKARQDQLGLGWANHDHHTYRSSRQNFSKLISLWEKLGFQLRERFYAGREAGWGAQVMEQPHARIVTFNDVDLSADELQNDFAHEPLAPREMLGTVGLWCGLHGDSFLQAGMHHLECQFDFDALREQLEATGVVKVMKPFTNFPYLRQAFTEGERWPVREDRIAMLLSHRFITGSQAKQFREQGAIGSHLENLERNEGFKGFNQAGVNEIIAATDPRRQGRVNT